MESTHRPFIEETIQRMSVQPRDRILEVGCGEGWACRLLAPLAMEGLVVGLDVSEEMIRKARAHSVANENLLLVSAGVEEIPWQENFFTKAFCMESFYYFENPERALREIYRVLSPGGAVWILNYLSKENELSLRWLPELKVPVQLCSAEEYAELFQRCGYENYAHRMIPDRIPLEETTQDPLFSDAQELRHFRELGALLLSARKPQE